MLDLSVLSGRQREVADRVIAGKSSRQIASELGVSIKTVETHRSHVNAKLGVHSSAELIRRYFEPGASVARAEVMVSYRHGEDLVVPHRSLTNVLGRELDKRDVRVTVEVLERSGAAAPAEASP